jgi:hypothetical protein
VLRHPLLDIRGVCVAVCLHRVVPAHGETLPAAYAALKEYEGLPVLLDDRFLRTPAYALAAEHAFRGNDRRLLHAVLLSFPLSACQPHPEVLDARPYARKDVARGVGNHDQGVAEDGVAGNVYPSVEFSRNLDLDLAVA